MVLSTPHVEKPQPQQPRSPSTRSLGSDHRPGGPPRDPSHHSASRAVGGSSSSSRSSSSTRRASGSSSGNNSSGAGGGVLGAASTTSSARSSFSSLPPRGAGVGASFSSAAVAGGVSRDILQKQYGAGGSRPLSPSGGFYDSRLVDSRGGSFNGTGRTSAPVGGGGRGGKPNPSKRQSFSSQGNSGQSSRALVGGYASSNNNSGGSSAASSPPSPPPMARVPPPLFVSAPRSPPHASPGVGAQGQDMDRRCLERVVEPADRQILSWHD